MTRGLQTHIRAAVTHGAQRLSYSSPVSARGSSYLRWRGL